MFQIENKPVSLLNNFRHVFPYNGYLKILASALALASVLTLALQKLCFFLSLSYGFSITLLQIISSL